MHPCNPDIPHFYPCPISDCTPTVDPMSLTRPSCKRLLSFYWGRGEFIAILSEIAGTALQRTLEQLTAALSTVRPHMEQVGAIRGITYPAIYSNAKTHDYCMFKSLLDSLTDLAKSHLLGIVRNMKSLVKALLGSISRHRDRAHSAVTLAHSLVARQ